MYVYTPPAIYIILCCIYCIIIYVIYEVQDEMTGNISLRTMNQYFKLQLVDPAMFGKKNKFLIKFLNFVPSAL